MGNWYPKNEPRPLTDEELAILAILEEAETSYGPTPDVPREALPPCLDTDFVLIGIFERLELHERLLDYEKWLVVPVLHRGVHTLIARIQLELAELRDTHADERIDAMSAELERLATLLYRAGWRAGRMN